MGWSHYLQAVGSLTPRARGHGEMQYSRSQCVGRYTQQEGLAAACGSDQVVGAGYTIGRPNAAYDFLINGKALLSEEALFAQASPKPRPEMLIERGRLLLNEKRWEDAADTFDEAARICDPGKKDWYPRTLSRILQGIALEDLGEKLKGEAKFDEAGNTFIRSAGAFEKARAYDDTARSYRRAAEAYKEGGGTGAVGLSVKAVQAYQNEANAHQKASDAYKKSGNKEYADRSLKLRDAATSKAEGVRKKARSQVYR